jgi:ABC-type enterobactin transport system permease subunit
MLAFNKQENIPCFPLEAVAIVRRRLADLLVQEHAVALVCSAACGADLIALEEAERLGLRRRIILPFRPELPSANDPWPP